MRRIFLAGWAAVLSLGLAAATMQAQDQSAPPPPEGAQAQSQAPANSDAVVARLSLIKGSVTTQRGDSSEWAAGAVNTPLASGDKVSVGANSRAEVQLDYADLLRLGDNAQANLTALNRTQFQIQLGAGLADYVVLKGTQASSEIDTPNISIRPNGAAVIRILVPSASETEVIVRQGEADISTPQGSTTLHQGQLITVQGTDTPEYKITDAPAEDAWDHWNNERDSAVANNQGVEHTNPYYTGVQDLDGYGYWTNVPGYGQVWVPYNQNNGWTPYSTGQWTWQPFWGWTWVDYSPWGWAPYHYGRWFYWNTGWAWWPGPVTPYYRPVWAPAYVSFFGWGGGFHVGFGFGSFGWIPIGPCDPFHPWWGVHGFFGFGFHARVGVVSALAVGGRGRFAYSNLAMMHTNARVRAAMIRVPSGEFGRGGVAAREHVSAAELGRGTAVRGNLGVVPNRASLNVGRVESRSASTRPAATHFFGHASVAARPSFAEEQNRFSARTAAAAGSERGAAPAARNDNGMRSFGGERAGTSSMAPATSAPRAGWQRFGASEGARGASPAAGNRMESSPARSQPAARPGWQRFTPQANNEGGMRGNGESRPSFGERGGNYSSYRGGNSRPPLEVGHPIVQSAPRGNESRPAPSARESAPRGNFGGGARPSGGGGGGHPSGGGSHGGGGHSHGR